ncbi:MAG TPA: transcription antitermination factor NusB [Bacteroidia bacterium]|nr:transcription antitermination factor NusB [Bacteroidia bacterium]
MLNRRYLRIKALQALYGYFQSEDGDMARGERELMRSIDRTYELYIYLLLVFGEIARVARNQIDLGREKMLPTQEDLNPNTRFVSNRLIGQFSGLAALNKEAAARKLTWQSDAEISMLRKMWEQVKSWDVYREYMNNPDSTYETDREFVLDFFKKFIADDDSTEQFLEEKNMHWPGDLNMAVAPTIIRTIENASESREPQLAPLFKDPEDDKQFVLDLYRKTILDNQKSEKLISEKTRNWEVERIALMDVLLMKMAITELQHFSSIPVKVTLNEYIEISKTYSTPRSKQFINGILDKLVADFRTDGSMKKTGRGLME